MSASVPGNIDCALTLEQKLEIEQVWDDGGSVSAEYVAVTDAARAVLDNQTANFRLLEDPDKDYDLKVWWPDDCRSGEPDDCEDECQVDGPVAGTQCVDYSLTDCFGWSWGITQKMFRTSNLTRDKLIAVEALKAAKIMDEKLDRKAMSLFMAARGTNKFSAGQYNVNGLVTEIPAAAWNADLMGYLYMAAKKNKQTLPRVLTDTNFAQYKWLVEMQKTNPTGAAEMAKLMSLGDPYFDINMDEYLGHKSTFLYQGNALFIANQARNAGMNRGITVPVAGDVPVTWDIMESKNLPGITYDLFYSKKCLAGGDIKESWRLQFRGGFFSNPTGCDTDRTGVLELRCV
jgi:hypothetical protein